MLFTVKCRLGIGAAVESRADGFLLYFFVPILIQSVRVRPQKVDPVFFVNFNEKYESYVLQFCLQS